MPSPNRFALPEILSWFSSKQRALKGSAVALMDIRERTDYLPAAAADFDCGETCCSLTRVMWLCFMPSSGHSVWDNQGLDSVLLDPRLKNIASGSRDWFTAQRRMVKDKPLVRRCYDLWYQRLLADANRVPASCRNASILELVLNCVN